jgi:hypothetical protein
MSDNTALKEYLYPRKRRQQEAEDNFSVRNFLIYRPLFGKYY